MNGGRCNRMKLKYKNFNMKDDGFVGHLAEPEQASDKAVIVIMGGEQSLLPGIKIAERFGDYGFIGPDGTSQPLVYKLQGLLYGVQLSFFIGFNCSKKKAEKGRNIL